MESFEKKNKLLKNIKRLYFICFIVIFLISLLQKYSVINVNFSLIPFYIISTLAILITIIVLFIKVEKIQYQNKMYSIILIGVIGFIILIFFAILVDYRTNSIKFYKHATKTNATIIDIKKDVKFHKDTCPAGYTRVGYKCELIRNRNDYKPATDYYELYYIYQLKYNVDNKTYQTTYKEKAHKRFSTENEAMLNETKYSKNDTLTIYYDNNNPQSIKIYVPNNYGIETYISGIITIIFGVFYYFKFKKFIDNNKINNV